MERNLFVTPILRNIFRAQYNGLLNGFLSGRGAFNRLTDLNKSGGKKTRFSRHTLLLHLIMSYLHIRLKKMAA